MMLTPECFAHDQNKDQPRGQTPTVPQCRTPYILPVEMIVSMDAPERRNHEATLMLGPDRWKAHMGLELQLRENGLFSRQEDS